MEATQDISIKDLSIGNIISVDNKRTPITEIYKDMVIINEDKKIPLSSIRGVKVSPTLLYLYGFGMCASSYYARIFKEGTLCIFFNLDGFDFLFKNPEDKLLCSGSNLKYLHQIQNILSSIGFGKVSEDMVELQEYLPN